MDNPTQAYLVMAALLALAALMVVGMGWAAKWAHWPLKQVARRLGGRLVWDGWWHYSEAEWTREGIVCRVSVQPPGSYQFGGVRVRFKRPCAGRLRLVPQSGFWSVRKFFGARDLEIGDPSFDSRFVIQADQATWARKILTPDIRARLLSLDRYEFEGLELGPAGITVRAGSPLVETLERLLVFVREALELGLAIHLVLDPGMAISEMEIGTIGSCPVCGTAVEGDGGLCSRCRTLHHRDCWDYLGGCAVFG